MTIHADNANDILKRWSAMAIDDELDCYLVRLAGTLGQRCQPGGPTRGDHQSTVADVLGRAPDGTCRSDDDYPDGFARRRLEQRWNASPPCFRAGCNAAEQLSLTLSGASPTIISNACSPRLSPHQPINFL